ncbi:hypothetical protein ACM61V_11315 [Sphingomonas sp. TX0543]|uniref:hypothetical protein n=1 Tax=unclassified Sphingomonas TaxID=196159 RepID=UPI0010F49766|nr:hypothetical protein [Sphingomonas sp. 3P27F8]
MKTSIIALGTALACATSSSALAQDHERPSDADIVVTGQYAPDEPTSASKTGQPILLTPQ